MRCAICQADFWVRPTSLRSFPFFFNQPNHLKLVRSVSEILEI